MLFEISPNPTEWVLDTETYEKRYGPNLLHGTVTSSNRVMSRTRFDDTIQGIGSWVMVTWPDYQGRTEYQRFERSNPRSRRLLRQEGLVLEAQEELLTLMYANRISEMSLSETLDRPREYVDQKMESNDLTLREVAEIADGMGCRVHLVLEPRGWDWSEAERLKDEE